jgi:ClpP class serine protease
VYDDFTSRVAAGRRLPKARVLEIARGRIWSGEDALGLGLVDELGGLDTAVGLARRAARIPETEAVALEIFPKPRTLWDAFRARFFGRPDQDRGDDPEARLLTGMVQALRPVARKLHALGLDAPKGVLSMPEVASGSLPD